MGTGTGIHWFFCPGQVKKGGGSKGGPPALAGTREYEQSDRNGNLEYTVGLSQREMCVHFNEGNLAQFRRSAEK